MTPAARRPALADLREARAAERAGNFRHAYYLRGMVAMWLHCHDETRRAVGVFVGARAKYRAFQEGIEEVAEYCGLLDRIEGERAARRGRPGDP